MRRGPKFPELWGERQDKGRFLTFFLAKRKNPRFKMQNLMVFLESFLWQLREYFSTKLGPVSGLILWPESQFERPDSEIRLRREQSFENRGTRVAACK